MRSCHAGRVDHQTSWKNGKLEGICICDTNEDVILNFVLSLSRRCFVLIAYLLSFLKFCLGVLHIDKCGSLSSFSLCEK